LLSLTVGGCANAAAGRHHEGQTAGVFL